MAAEAIPLINALLEAMGLTAAGSAKGKKYDVPEQVNKHASGALDAAAGLASKNPVKVVRGVKTMLTSGKAEAPKEAIKDENYDELPEDMKKDLADLVNKEFSGFGGDPDDKDKKPKNDKNPPPPAAKKPKEMKADSDLKDYNDRLAEARANRKRWGEEIEVTEDQFMGGSKAAHKAEKMKKMSSPEAVQRSREQFMEGKPNSLDTDKAVSEYKGYQKSQVANKPVEQSKTDILEHRRAPEDMRMTNKYSIKKDPIDEIKEENAPKFDSKFPAIAPIPVIIRILKEEFGMDDEDAEEVTDGINTIQYYDGNNASKEDKSIRDKMIDDLKKLLGFDIYQKVKDYSAEYYAEQAKKDAEKEGDK